MNFPKLPKWMDHWSLNRHLQRAHSMVLPQEDDDWRAFIAGRSNHDLRLFHLTLHLGEDEHPDSHWHNGYGLPLVQPDDSPPSGAQSDSEQHVPDSPATQPLQPVSLFRPRLRL